MNPPQRGRKKEERSDVHNIEAVLLFYGADRVPHSSGWSKMKCPVHGERVASATVNTDEGAFMCFSCGAKGDALAIIKVMENDCSFLQACAKYEEITGQKIAGLTSRRGNDTATTAQTKSYESGGYLVNRLRK